MQIKAAEEPPEVMILEGDTEDVNIDDVLPEPSETNTVATEEHDVIILEDSAVMSLAPVLTTTAPEAGSECCPKHKHAFTQAIYLPYSAFSSSHPPFLLLCSFFCISLHEYLQR